MKSVIHMKKISKTFQMGSQEVKALQEVDIHITQGEFVAIMGPSGSGKSTLMNILGCLDTPSGGEYFLDGEDTANADKNEYAKIRNQKINFVFQGFNLLPRTTALENVQLPLMYNHHKEIHNTKEIAIKALEEVGLAQRVDHIPNQLSGGQQQRVAIARALVNDPTIILADEPTGNLDSRTSVEVMNIFQKLNEMGKTIILVTHEQEIAAYTKRSIVLKDGKIIFDKPIQNRLQAKEVLKSLEKN